MLDIEAADERARVDTGSRVQSVLFISAGFDRDHDACSFTAVASLSVA